MITVSGCLGSPTYQEPPGIPRERTGGGGALSRLDTGSPDVHAAQTEHRLGIIC